MKDFWKRLFGWICGILFIIASAFFIVGLETGEGFFDVISDVTSRFDLDPFAQIKEEAYNKGFQDGRSEGYSENEKDRNKSYDAGYENGYNKGYNDGLNGREKEESKISESSESSASSSSGGGGNGGFTDYGEAEEICNYVLNKNTGKFHRLGCSSVSNIKPNNREYFTGTRGEAIARGYDPCGRCNP